MLYGTIINYNKTVDNIAISNYLAGGMENWGLIIYADDLMLVDLDKDSPSYVQFAARLVSHEIAHMVNLFYICPKGHIML
jgi:aminopeptidase N